MANIIYTIRQIFVVVQYLLLMLTKSNIYIYIIFTYTDSEI